MLHGIEKEIVIGKKWLQHLSLGNSINVVAVHRGRFAEKQLIRVSR